VVVRQPDTIIICLARAPEVGKIKTRLAAEIGEVRALDIYRELLSITAKTLIAVPRAVEISLDGKWETRDFRKIFGSAVSRSRQPKGDLGEKMHSLAADAFSGDYARVILIGSDCPDLTPQILEQANAALTNHDLVLGPAADGGYYLIGMKRPHPELFRDISWGTDAVLLTTIDRAEQHQLSFDLLEELFDIDRLADWQAYCRSLE
jgi:hypothetical protein